MSILNKLKNLNTRKAARLLEVHPLAGESLELRLQYLAGVALATAIDREPNDAERMAFNALADSLQVDAVDAQEQLDERASVTEEDIALLFAAIRERDAGYLYLLDLAWIHAADGELEENELAVTEELAGLLELDARQVRNLHEFALLLKQRKVRELLSAVIQLPPNPALQDLLPVVLKPCFPFFGVLQGRWLDHGDGTATDAHSGLMWHRASAGKIGLKFSWWNPFNTETRSSAEAALQEFNNLSPANYQDWRTPNKNELEGISTKNRIPDYVFLLETLETQSIYYTNQEQQQQQQQQQQLQMQTSPYLELICCRDWKGNQ